MRDLLHATRCASVKDSKEDRSRGEGLGFAASNARNLAVTQHPDQRKTLTA